MAGRSIGSTIVSLYIILLVRLLQIISAATNSYSFEGEGVGEEEVEEEKNGNYRRPSKAVVNVSSYANNISDDNNEKSRHHHRDDIIGSANKNSTNLMKNFSTNATTLEIFDNISGKFLSKTKKSSGSNEIRSRRKVVLNKPSEDKKRWRWSNELNNNRKRTKRLVVNTTAILAKLKTLLSPKLTTRSASVNLDWSNYARKTNDYVGSTLTLYDGAEPVTHLMNTPDRKNHHYTITGLEQDRIYKGSVKLLQRPDEVKYFFRDELSAGDNADESTTEKFELTTPFVVSGKYFSSHHLFRYIYIR